MSQPELFDPPKPKPMGKIDVNYACSVCNKPVKVTPKPKGQEPDIERSCDHKDALVIAWLSGTMTRVKPFAMGTM